MNERIQQFEKECWETQQLADSAHSWHTAFNSQKFANLILFECVKLAVFKGDTATAKAIKEHFDIK